MKKVIWGLKIAAGVVILVAPQIATIYGQANRQAPQLDSRKLKPELVAQLGHPSSID
jgi:hypothetical protein